MGETVSSVGETLNFGGEFRASVLILRSVFALYSLSMVSRRSTAEVAIAIGVSKQYIGGK